MDELFVRYGLYLWLATVVVLLGALVWIASLGAKLNRTVAHYHRLIDGVDATSLPAVLDEHVATAREAARRVDQLNALYMNLDKVLRGAVQHVGLVRYNPFGDTGGDQSFSLALLNDAGDGVVVTSLYARERTRVYAKPVTGGRSTYHLSDEEEQAIAVAGAPGEAEARPISPTPAPTPQAGEVTPT